MWNLINDFAIVGCGPPGQITPQRYAGLFHWVGARVVFGFDGGTMMLLLMTVVRVG